MKLQVISAVAAVLLFVSPQVEAAASCTKTYTAKKGDSCWSIGNANGLSSKQFTTLNPDLDCSPLQIGAKVCLSTAKQPKVKGCKSYYQAVSGDYCEKIAGKFKLTTVTLTSDNPGLNCNNVQIGDVFCINYGQGTLPRIPIPDSRCTIPGTFAITFDDGPYLYTGGLLDYLKKNKLKATFFLNGKNYGLIYNFNSTVRRMIAEGHQVAHHTWSHPDITTLTAAKLTEEITSLETAFRAIMGKTPTFFRPPYGNTNLLSLSILLKWKFRVIKWDIDNSDSLSATPLTLAQEQNNFLTSLKAAGVLTGKRVRKDGHISLAHDPKKITAQKYAPWEYTYVKNLGYKTVTVAECLGVTNSSLWYRK